MKDTLKKSGEDNLLKYKKLKKEIYQKEIYQKERLLITCTLISFVTLLAVYWLDKYFELGNWFSYGVTFVIVLPYYLYVLNINIKVAIKRYKYHTTGRIEE
ncbi:hypothetical protein COI63_10995 [Bacillus toyonensis]|nr:hypothetical protein CN594_25390 [Bacillus toyonensis]PEO56335.1 hypothetical protein CN579_21065 [Bacillus toyonensis]PFY41182.1 hypothetical protein COL55_23665 [Bacillus toyonensis]PFY44465.1 hypothetical protein COL54_11510 [Bacillus toyonensis]PFY81347.1 hypothetical protein COL62_10875 [Bacillus toyonensis]